MNKKVLVIVFFIAVSAIVNAENTPKDVVTSFGKALSAWCQSGDISYRIELERLCNGVKKCRVEDKIHADYQRKYGFVDDDKTFVLDSYLNMFQTLMSEGIRFNMSNITVETQDHYPDGQVLTFITADIRVSGKLNYTVKDLFLVRDDKISGIYNYSSQLGFQHLNGSLIEALEKGKYVSTEGFKNGCAVVKTNDGQVHLIDLKGNVRASYRHCESIRYKGDENNPFAWGVDEYGQFVVSEPLFDLRTDKTVPFMVHFNPKYANQFEEGYALVGKNIGGVYKYGYLKQDDLYYKNVEFIYDDVTGFDNGLAKVSIRGSSMIIDKSLNVILRETDKYSFNDDFLFDKDMIIVRDKTTKKYGVMNSKGDIIIPCRFTRIKRAHNGLALVSIDDWEPLDGGFGPKTGLANLKGELVVPCIYHLLQPFTRGDESGYRALRYEQDVEVEEFIDENGVIKDLKSQTDLIAEKVARIKTGVLKQKQIDSNIIIKEIGHKNEDGLIKMIEESPYIPNLIEGGGHLALIHNKMQLTRSRNGAVVCKYGWKDSKGEIIIPSIYDYTSDFKNGFACLGKDGLYGLVNKDGIFVIPCICDNPIDYENGIALVSKTGQVGLVDMFGNFVFF